MKLTHIFTLKFFCISDALNLIIFFCMKNFLYLFFYSSGTNSLGYFLYLQTYWLFLFLRDTFTGYRILGWPFLSYLKNFVPLPLTYMIVNEKIVTIESLWPLRVFSFFSTFKTFSFVLNVQIFFEKVSCYIVQGGCNLMILLTQPSKYGDYRCEGLCSVDFFGFILFEVFSACWICWFTPFIKSGKFLAIISSHIFQSCFLSFFFLFLEHWWHKY